MSAVFQLLIVGSQAFSCSILFVPGKRFVTLAVPLEIRVQIAFTALPRILGRLYLTLSLVSHMLISQLKRLNTTSKTNCITNDG